MSTACPNCQNSVSSDAAYCDNCGANLRPQPAGGPTERRCAVCGARAQADDTNCHICGAELPPTNVPEEIQIVWPGASTPLEQNGERTCPNCGNQARDEACFCDRCGSALGTPARPSVSQRDVGIAPVLGIPAPQTALEAREADAGRTMVEFPRPGARPTEPTELRFIDGSLVLVAWGVRLEFPPKRTEILVGREDPFGNVFPEIDLTHYGGETGGVSRQHARLYMHGGELFIEDLNSRNGTFVNRERVPPGSRRALRPGDEVRFGRVIARYERN